MDLPTAYWHEWVEELTLGDTTFPQDVKHVIIGGEKASKDKVNKWFKTAPTGVHLYNTYGPTEVTIVSNFQRLTSIQYQAEIPIGQCVDLTFRGKKKGAFHHLTLWPKIF